MSNLKYRGRFAPSPTGFLHLGSLTTALASWLDARAHNGCWLIRMEDIDELRCQKGVDQRILQQLAACGLFSDEEVVWQSKRHFLYENALLQLIEKNWVYRCFCTRKEIQTALSINGLQTERHEAAIYLGACRPLFSMVSPLFDSTLLENASSKTNIKKNHAWRLNTKAVEAEMDFQTNQKSHPSKHEADEENQIAQHTTRWQDRRLGWQEQMVSQKVGDFVLKRSDGFWAYQLVVVVDDAIQNITNVVRGEDLCDNTARQILLQRALGLPTPFYLHTPLICDENGEKLSKQQGAKPIETHSLDSAKTALCQAARALSLPVDESNANRSISEHLLSWVQVWAGRF